MKLTANQLETAQAALGVDPIPDDNPAMDELKAAFGEHTYYLSDNGLLAFEPDADPETSETTVRLMVMAAWADEEKTSLAPVEPQPTNIVVELQAEGTDPTVA